MSIFLLCKRMQKKIKSWDLSEWIWIGEKGFYFSSAEYWEAGVGFNMDRYFNSEVKTTKKIQYKY